MNTLPKYTIKKIKLRDKDSKIKNLAYKFVSAKSAEEWGLPSDISVEDVIDYSNNQFEIDSLITTTKESNAKQQAADRKKKAKQKNAEQKKMDLQDLKNTKTDHFAKVILDFGKHEDKSLVDVPAYYISYILGLMKENKFNQRLTNKYLSIFEAYIAKTIINAKHVGVLNKKYRTKGMLIETVLLEGPNKNTLTYKTKHGHYILGLFAPNLKNESKNYLDTGSIYEIEFTVDKHDKILDIAHTHISILAIKKKINDAFD